MAALRSRMYRELAELPAYLSAYFLKSTSEESIIQAAVSVRDHTRSCKRSLLKHIIRTSSGTIVTPSVDLSDALVSVPSPSGKRRAVLRQTSDKKRFAEIWIGDRLEVSKDVTLDHEEFYTQPTFFSLSFSSCESALLYCAERKSSEDKKTTDSTPDKFRFLPDFGEQHYGKRRPTLFILRWKDLHSVQDAEHNGVELTAVEPTLPYGTDSHVAFGQAVLAPDGRSIYATAYELTEDGRRLGIVGCWNRPTGIWRLSFPVPVQDLASSETWEVIANRITDRQLSCRFPSITSPDERGSYHVVWLANPVGGPHASATRLYVLNSGHTEPKILVDYVYDQGVEKDFPGLYTYSLPACPFVKSAQGLHVLVHSSWRSQSVLLAISLETGNVINLTPQSDYAWTVQNTDGKQSILASRSSLKEPEQLLYGALQDDSGSITVSWTVLEAPILSPMARASLDSLRVSVHCVPKRFPTEIILLRPSSTSSSSPLLNFVHGGPHTAVTSAFDAANVAYALEGYNVAFINYTGSLGFGQKHVESLIGRAGELDVQDCIGAADYLVEGGYATKGVGKQFVLGGSHGGFLGAHLVGQYPDFFSATVLRNPVTAVGECASVSDIPDWSHLEFGSSFSPSTTLTPDVFAMLHNASPIAHVDKVKAPVLLLVGERDRRVPPPQAMALYHALKGRGALVDMLTFPENGHALDGVEAQLISWEATVAWLGQFKKD